MSDTELFYITKTNKDGVKLTYKEVKAALSALKPLRDDFIKNTKSTLACLFFDLDGLNIADCSDAHDLIMNANLHKRTKERAKQAFKSDARFRVGATA